MSIIHKIFSLIDWKINTPKSYGFFHIISIIIMIMVIVLVAKSVKHNPDKVVKKTLMVFSIVTIVLELMKQGLFTHEASAYQWYAFPFQFCSTPMYVALLCLIVKNDKIKNALYSFLAYYGLFGGFVVMLYPNDVFIDLIMIDIQTMVHHGGMVVVGFTLSIANKVKFNLKGLLNATYVFIGLITVAQILNIIAHYSSLESFNMFFISPFESNHLPILSDIQKNQPYIVFLLIYIVGFAFAAFLVQKLGLLIHNIYYKSITKSTENQKKVLSENRA